MALYRAQIEAVKGGLPHIYVAAADEAPWDPDWACSAASRQRIEPYTSDR